MGMGMEVCKRVRWEQIWLEDTLCAIQTACKTEPRCMLESKLDLVNKAIRSLRCLIPIVLYRGFSWILSRFPNIQ